MGFLNKKVTISVIIMCTPMYYCFNELKYPTYDVNVYARASSTLNASSVGTLINTAGKLFHVRIAEGKYEF
jgi:hypothetical protein